MTLLALVTAPRATVPLTSLDLASVGVAFVALAVVVGVLVWFRRRRRDEVYVGVTPGERPAPGSSAGTRRLRGSGEWDGTVAVRFTPPDDVTPGIAGTVVDGRADHVDLSATIIDLAVRGHLTITAVRAEPDDDGPVGGPAADVPEDLAGRRPRWNRVPGEGPPPKARRGATASDEVPAKPVDWLLTRQHSTDTLRPYEKELLHALLGSRPAVRLGDLRESFGMSLRAAQIALYREVVDRGWYREHPQARNRRLGCLGLPLLLLGLVLAVVAALALSDGTAGPLELAPGVALVLSGGLLLWGGKGRTPRTADGTAVRVQTLGFREYLTTAEADQIRFEEAQDVFSRYLPYAIVFGCAERWSRIFGEVAAKAHLAGIGDAAFDLDWIQGLDLLVDVADVGLDALRVVDAFDGPGLVDVGQGLGDLVPTDLLDTMTNGLGELAGGLGDFVSSVGDLFDGLDGCGDGCDGCDLSF